jgi:hypothetical protein
MYRKITVDFCYDVKEGTEQIVSSQTSVALSEMQGKSEGKIFKNNTGL